MELQGKVAQEMAVPVGDEGNNAGAVRGLQKAHLLRMMQFNQMILFKSNDLIL